MTLTKSLSAIIPLSLIVLGLLSYNFINAQWSNAPANAPSNNVPTPINVGSLYQPKLGDLGAIRMRAAQYCDATGTVCSSVPTGGGSVSSNMQFLGYYTSPDIRVTIPGGTTKLIITPSGSAACRLPGDSGSGAGLSFRADGTQYALLRSDASNNNGGYTSITGSANGVVDVTGKSSVDLSVTKQTFNTNYALYRSGSWTSSVLCPNGSATVTSFSGYAIYAVNS